MTKTMKYAIFLLLLTLSQNVAKSQTIEQQTLDYFFESIFKTKYPELSKIMFSQETERTFTSALETRYCFDSLDERERFRRVAPRADSTTISLSLSITGLRVIKPRQKSSVITVRVFKALNVGENIYVLISVYKRNEFADRYLFEIDQYHKIKRWCINNEVI